MSPKNTTDEDLRGGSKNKDPLGLASRQHQIWVPILENVSVDETTGMSEFFLKQPVVTKYLKFVRRDKLCIGHLSFA